MFQIYININSNFYRTYRATQTDHLFYFISVSFWLNIFHHKPTQRCMSFAWHTYLMYSTNVLRKKSGYGTIGNIYFCTYADYIKSSDVSHSDGSCVLGRIHSDVSSNIPKVYHIVTDNFVNLLRISYTWLYKTECWGRKFHAFSFNSHRNCKIFMTNFTFIFDTICVPYIFRKSIFGWNCDHDTPLCDTPLLEDTPLCDTPDET